MSRSKVWVYNVVMFMPVCMLVKERRAWLEVTDKLGKMQLFVAVSCSQVSAQEGSGSKFIVRCHVPRVLVEEQEASWAEGGGPSEPSYVSVGIG